jgi:hypothetical protein
VNAIYVAVKKKQHIIILIHPGPKIKSRIYVKNELGHLGSYIIIVDVAENRNESEGKRKSFCLKCTKEEGVTKL